MKGAGIELASLSSYHWLLPLHYLPFSHSSQCCYFWYLFFHIDNHALNAIKEASVEEDKKPPNYLNNMGISINGLYQKGFEMKPEGKQDPV